MSDPLYFAPLEVPFVNTKTGIISREWYRFLLSLWNRVGGSQGLPGATGQAGGSQALLGSGSAGVSVANIAMQAVPRPLGQFPNSDSVMSWLNAGC